MWGLAGQFVVHSVFSLLSIFQVWRPLSRPQADSVSLRLGHGAALTCHRHVIHYRAAAALPLKLPRCSLIRALLHMFFDRLNKKS